MPFYTFIEDMKYYFSGFESHNAEISKKYIADKVNDNILNVYPQMNDCWRGKKISKPVIIQHEKTNIYYLQDIELDDKFFQELVNNYPEHFI